MTSHSELEAETGGDQRRDCSLTDADRQAWHGLAHINASMRRFESGEQIRAAARPLVIEQGLRFPVADRPRRLRPRASAGYLQPLRRFH